MKYMTISSFPIGDLPTYLNVIMLAGYNITDSYISCNVNSVTLFQ